MRWVKRMPIIFSAGSKISRKDAKAPREDRIVVFVLDRGDVE